MNKIKLLSDKIINLIAAGEVVERPASAVKEIIENSIDSGATDIRVYLENNGLSLIEVRDNGSGISRGDLPMVLKQHATSKIASEADLLNITSLGFRGEALASIAEVSSKLEIDSKTEIDQASLLIYQKDKAVIKNGERLETGTTVRVFDILSAVPARKKFLKSNITELKKICDTFISVAFINTGIHMELYSDNKLLYKLTKTKEIQNRIFEVWGKDITKGLIESSVLKSSMGDFKMFVGLPEIARKSTPIQYIYVNNRAVTEKTVASAVNEAFKGFIHKELKPVYFAIMQINPSEVDVNIHPRKLEVRFVNPGEIFRNTYSLVFKTIDKKTREKMLQALPKESTLEFSNQSYPSFFNSQPKSFNKNFSIKPTKSSIESAISFTKLISSPITELSAEVNKSDEYNPSLVIPVQLFNTYILFEWENKVIVIDQHAAAEKINFEKIVSNLSKPARRPLLLPEIIELPKHLKTKLMSKEQSLSEIGISIEDFGQNSIKVTEVPEIVSKGINISDLIEKIIEEEIDNLEEMYIKYKEIYPNLTPENYYLIATTACHSSIRAGQKLNIAEMEQLLHDLKKLKNPYNCPHGRPVIWELRKEELEKNFKRKL